MGATSRYREVLLTPQVRSTFGSAFVSRIPVGLEPLAVVLVVREAGWSYAVAGAVAACGAVGLTLAGPINARLADRIGAWRVLIPLALVHAVALLSIIAFAAASSPLPALMAGAALSGATLPPTQGVMRALWPQLLERRESLVAAAYALDGVTFELVLMTGPLVVAVFATAGEPGLALVLSAVATVVGAVAFATRPSVRGYHPAAEPGRAALGRLGALRAPGVRTLALTMIPIGFCLGAAEVAFPAFGEWLGDRALGGPLLAVWAIGSAVGGLLYGGYASGRPVGRLFVAMTAVVPLVTLPLALPTAMVAMVPLTALAGIAVAPMLIAVSQLIEELAPRAALTEAFTWPLTALTAGAAAGNGVSGAVIEAFGWRAAFASAAAVGTAGAVLAVARRSTLVSPAPAA